MEVVSLSFTSKNMFFNPIEEKGEFCSKKQSVAKNNNLLFNFIMASGTWSLWLKGLPSCNQSVKGVSLLERWSCN